MLLSAMKYARGYVYVQLTGYAPERFLNLCGNHNILIWNLKPSEDGYFFCISVDGFRELKPILKKTRTKIKIIRKCGIPFTAFQYRKRKLYGAGFFLFGILLYYLSGFVWNIEINGNSYLSQETILDFLQEEESYFGVRKSDIDCANLEEALRSRYEEVIWTSIKIYGTKMTVDIQENLLPEEEYVQAEDTIYDIVASKDAVIEEIITRNGTPKVTPGIEVKKGELLVSGRLDIIDDNGEVSQYLYRSSDADITGRVCYQYKDVISKEYEDHINTENNCNNYVLQLFQTRISNPFFKVKYKDYFMVSDTRQLHVTSNFYLPVSLTKENYQEYIKKKKTRTEEEIRQIATKNLNNYIEDLEEKGIQIIEKNVMIERTSKNYVVSGEIWAYESIVSYQPTEIITITNKEELTTNESE